MGMPTVMVSPTHAERWVMHNARYDLRALGWDKLDPVPPVDDTMLLAALLGLERVGLKVLDERFFGGIQGDRIARMLDDVRACQLQQWAIDAQDAEMAALLAGSPTKLTLKALKLWLDAEEVLHGGDAGRKRQLVDRYPLPNPPDVDDLPWPRLREYSGRDAALTMRLYRKLEGHPDFDAALSVYRRLEEPLFPVLNQMEDTGIALDASALKLTDSEFESRIAQLQADLVDHVGFDDLNVLVPAQLREFLYGRLELPVYERTKEMREPSTAKRTLELLALEEPIVRVVLEMKHLAKLRSTYTNALAERIGPDGRLHGRFNQLKADRLDDDSGEQATETGRLSSSDPNLQNIPIRAFDDAHDYGRLIRRAFVPREGNRWVSADYSGIELVILAALADDEPFLNEFHKPNPDPHIAMARRAMGSAWDRASSDERVIARKRWKNVNYLIPYGGSAERLVVTSNFTIPRAEGEALIAQWFEIHPAVRAYMDAQVRSAREHGYVETVLGRRRYIPEIHSTDDGLRRAAERVAGNMPIQGTSADLTKLALRRVWELLGKEHRGDLVNVVHDEIDLDTNLPSERIRAILVEGMVTYPTPILNLGVPIRIEIGEGKSWADAH